MLYRILFNLIIIVFNFVMNLFKSSCHITFKRISRVSHVQFFNRLSLLICNTSPAAHQMNHLLGSNRALSMPSLSYQREIFVVENSVREANKPIELKLSVVDTHPDDKSNRPVVVGIHGIPGSGMDFEPLITQLAKTGIRFVAPTFPGFEPSLVESWKLKHLDYTTEGRASLVEKIMQELRVDKIHLLIAHSAGSWLAKKMAADWDSVLALCLLNPGGARPHRSLRPFAAIRFIAWVLMKGHINFILLPLMQRVYGFLGFSGVTAGEHLIVSQQVVSYQGFEKMSIYAKKIQEKKLPMVLAYTLNDKLIEREIYEELLLQHYGVPQSHIFKYVKNEHPSENVFQKTAGGWLARGLQFERGGHIVHKPNSTVIMDHIMDVFKHLGCTLDYKNNQ